MIALLASVAIIAVHDSVSFACGIDGIRGYCIGIAIKDPIERGYFLFVNRSRTQARVMWYDGQGFMLTTKRLSQRAGADSCRLQNCD